MHGQLLKSLTRVKIQTGLSVTCDKSDNVGRFLISTKSVSVINFLAGSCFTYLHCLHYVHNTSHYLQIDAVCCPVSGHFSLTLQ